MSVGSLRAHLEFNRPSEIASAYDLASRYRVTEDTARDQLRTAGYIIDPTSKTWKRQETQLDRIEKMLINLTVLQDPTATVKILPHLHDHS